MKLLTMFVLASSLGAFAQGEWKIVKTFAIGGTGAWDYLTVDPRTHQLYVPRTTHTLVIDSETGKTIADIPGQKNAHGVAIAPAAGRGFISDGGGDGSIVIFDLKTNAVLGTVPAMEDADGIIFDPASGKVLVVSGRGKTFMAFRPDIDPQKGKIEDRVALRGEPEFLAADATGKVYINLMDTNEVAVVDLAAKKVITHWSVAPGGAPVGMAIDADKGRLFIGCRKPQRLIAMSTRDGKVLADLPIGESVDAVKLDRGQVFASTAGSQLVVAGETAPGKFAVTQIAKTGEGARTMGLDPTTHRIYLPSADYVPGANGKQSVKPGTFKILVAAQ
jgi:DNA-binding beta-propeller fold protein YncE